MGKLLWSPIRPGENWAQTLVRVAGNLLRWIIGLPIVVGLLIWGGVAGYGWWSDRPHRISELEGIAIGMTPTDVTLIKGAPRSSGPEERNDGSWVEGMFFDDLLVLLKGPSKDKITVFRVCDTKPKYYDKVLGISGSDSERSVIRHLGEPDEVVIDDDKLGKASHFDRYNLMIRFKKAQVEAICVGI